MGDDVGAERKVEHANEVLNSEISKKIAVPSAEEAKEQLGFENNVAWLRDDTYTDPPNSLIGRVFYKLGDDPALRSHIFSLDLEILPNPNVKPLLRQELILNAETSASAGFLSFLELKVGAKEVYELRVMDNAKARADVVGERWTRELETWFERHQSGANSLMASSGLTFCAVVTGVVQKYITTKRYTEFEGTGKGGGYGVNVEGRLFLSSEQYDLDIAYGLSLQDLTPFLGAGVGAVDLKSYIEANESSEVETPTIGDSERVTRMFEETARMQKRALSVR